jgi:PHD/YefM family antitoxin component YafN of YafNO toxin-antitoxin module
MTDGPHFTTLDATQLPPALAEILCRTARHHGRIEVTNCDGESCVILSKQELESLERALEILADSDGGQAMRHTVERFATLVA